jgi:hypothetical protein
VAGGRYAIEEPSEADTEVIGAGVPVIEERTLEFTRSDQDGL